jgi:ADP-heptose:LPS heptosyltransferase
VVVLGEAERERWPAARLDRWREARNVCEPADAVALSQRIAGASCYIGNDSGPTHLAAQLGVPTIALFGPSDRRVWRPVGPAVTVIAPPTPTDMTWLKSRAVIAAAPRG